MVKEYPHRASIQVKDGVVLVGSDFHIWPGEASVALRAFKRFCKELKPAAVVLNGDVLDFPMISKHKTIMWESLPFPIEEIEAAQDHLNDIALAAPKSASKCWPLGNHDQRFETAISNALPQLRGVTGVHLADNFALWQKCWSAWINDSVVIKHRFKGGAHAPHNNVMWSGRSIITGHLHSQKVIPYTDYSGTRYGVDTGCVADTDHRAFTAYTEDNPLNWRSGFCVLTFKDGQMLAPELVTKWDDSNVQFRGKIVRV